MQNDLSLFNDATDRFYSGNLGVKEYKLISSTYGSFSHRGGGKGMVRLRLAGGRITAPKMRYICDCIERYHPEFIHFTTRQSVQLHGLDPESINEIVSSAPEHGINTFGGGGDYPRNITVTPLSGVIKSSRLDIMPHAQAVEDYLLKKAEVCRLPRKLKIGMSCTEENIADATATDLGFVVREDGLFDIYSGGGLGKDPKLGLLVDESVDPSDVLVYADAMFRMFMEYGNHEDRTKARVSFIRTSLGDDGFRDVFHGFVKDSRNAVPKFYPEQTVVEKNGDGSIPSSDRVRPQSQDGLYYIYYHPIGGDPMPAKLVEIFRNVMEMEGAEVRISPNQTMYIVNLTGKEADAVSGMTSDGARTVFESSMSCVGSKICQLGLRDSNGLLKTLVDMERREGFADRILPMIRISGCHNSCSAHQVGAVALCGTKSVDGEEAYSMFVNGSHVLGKEKLGDEIGVVKTKDIPGLFRMIGKTVESSGAQSFFEWYNLNRNDLKSICSEYFC